MIYNFFFIGIENLIDLSGILKKVFSVFFDFFKIVSGIGLFIFKGRGLIFKLLGLKFGRDSSSRELILSDENLVGLYRGKVKVEEKKVLKKYLWEKLGRVKVRF